MRHLRAAAAVGVAAASLAGCMGGGTRAVDPLPEPPTTVAASSTTAVPDFSEVALPGVPGRTTTTAISLGPGEAGFQGTVAGPEGPVAGATVRVERLVDGAVAPLEVVSQPDGTWALPGIRGGGYRVRAWRSPDLALVEPAFVFVAAKQTRPLDLKLDRYAGPQAIPAVAPNPPVVGLPTALAVRVDQRSVDARGFVVVLPLVGAKVQLFSATGGWAAVSANPTVTDGDGRARWDLRCRAAGVQPLTISLADGAEQPLKLPACAEPAPEPAPVPASPAPTAAPAPTTATTRPGR